MKQYKQIGCTLATAAMLLTMTSTAMADVSAGKAIYDRDQGAGSLCSFPAKLITTNGIVD